MRVVDQLPLTAECHHYTGIGEVPWDIQKYWSQRYSIFASYDDGIQLTNDAWFGVTPEPVATKIAWELSAWTSQETTTIVDMFGGAGGNAIAFALSGRWQQIIAVEKDESVLACAMHNAAIYGVKDAITWVLGDSFEYLEKLLNEVDELEPQLQVNAETTVIFASPPWGGPGYTTDEIFDLHNMEPYNLAQLHTACRAIDHALYLPRTSDLRQIAKLAPPGQKVEVVQYCMEGASKAMVVYIPANIQVTE